MANEFPAKSWSPSTTSDSASYIVRLIGAGTCGRIYHLANDATTCLKREKDHHFTGRGLLNDYSMHQRIYSTFSEASPEAATNIHIPQPFTFFAKADISLKQPHWATLHAQFPANDQQPHSMLYMERIPPVPRPLQSALISRYYPPRLREKAHADPANGDCLIRPYLGRVGRERTTP